MKQHNQIGKYTKKEDVLMARKGKTFVTPSNKEWVFDYSKQGNKYIYIICYKNQRMQLTESDFNKMPTDFYLDLIDNTINE